MPSKKKRKVELAKDDGSGLPLKWRFVDDSVAAKAQRKQQRYIQQADETEAAAQREKASAEKVALARTDPDHGVDEGVQFAITLDSGRRTRSSMKKSPENPSALLASSGKSSPESGPEPARTQFEVTLSASGDASQQYLVEESHVRDFSEGAVAQPPVTAAARKRRNGESGSEWDPYLVQLLTEVRRRLSHRQRM